MPKVSVNICCYNSERFIEQTVKSVLAQTYGDLEIVIVDDGSTDRTGEIIKSIADDRIKYHHQENHGLSYARNRAIDLSRGEYIAFLDHDDTWLPEKLAKQVALFQKDSALGLVYSDCYAHNLITGQKVRYSEMTTLYRGRVLEQLFHVDFIPVLTAVIKREVIGKVGKFDLNYKIAEDYEFFVRVADQYPVDFVPEPLAVYHLHEDNSVKKQRRNCFLEEKALLTAHRGKFSMISEEAFQRRFMLLNRSLALLALAVGDRREARKYLRGDVLYLMATYLPSWLLRLIMEYKAKRRGAKNVLA